MSDAVPDLSVMCTRSDHGRCPHTVGVRLPRPWRRQAEAEMLLCRCTCHALCPLAADRTVLREVWQASCTCPGADRLRASLTRSAERREELRRIAAEVDMAGHPDAEEIESRLRAVFEEHGQPPPPGMTTWSRLLAAGAARRGTRRPRVLGMGVHAVGTTVRWSYGTATSDDDAENRRQVRAGYRVAGAVAGVATVLTGSAVASSGPRRLVLGLAALVAWLGSGYAVSAVTAIGQFTRWVEDHPHAQDLPSR